MRCQCIICQELFENVDEVIAALDCGHTFHSVCLTQWLENGRTCPSCRKAVNRKNIIHRLYFDAPEDVDAEVDRGRLENELDRLKLEIRKKEADKNSVIKDKEEIQNRLARVEKLKTSVEKELKQEQSNNSAHLKTLRYYQSQQSSLEAERQECRKIKQKMALLQGCETLLNGCETDAAEILSNTGDGPGAVQTLSKQVAFLKREYEKLKLEKKQMKEQYEKILLKDAHKNKLYNELKADCETLKEQLERSEGDLKVAERELEFLKKTNSELKRKWKDNSSSSFTRMMNESDYMNMFTSSTPKLGRHVSSVVDLDLTPDLFDSPAVKKSPEFTKPPKQVDKRCSQFVKRSVKRPLEPSENMENEGVNTVKTLKMSSVGETFRSLENVKSESSVADANSISTIAGLTNQAEDRKYSQLGKKSVKRPVELVTDANSISTLAGMAIFNRRTLGEGPSITRKGYDGLGGHTTFVNTQGGSKNMFKKHTVKRNQSKQVKTASTDNVHRTTEYRRKMKEENGERYALYLEKQKIRAKEGREKMKKELKKKKPSKNIMEKKERQLEQQRKRQAKYMEKLTDQPVLMSKLTE